MTLRSTGPTLSSSDWRREVSEHWEEVDTVVNDAGEIYTKGALGWSRTFRHKKIPQAWLFFSSFRDAVWSVWIRGEQVISGKSSRDDPPFDSADEYLSELAARNV